MRRAVRRPRCALAKAGELRDVRRQTIFGTAALLSLPAAPWARSADQQRRSTVSDARKAHRRILIFESSDTSKPNRATSSKPQRSYTLAAHARRQQHDARRAALRRIQARMIDQRAADAAAALRFDHVDIVKARALASEKNQRRADSRRRPTRRRTPDNGPARCRPERESSGIRAAQRRRQRTNRRMRGGAK